MVKIYRAMVFVFVLVFAAGVIMPFAFAQKPEDESGLKEGAKAAGGGVKTVCDAAVNYPANLVNDSVNVVGTAAKNAAGMVVDTGKAAGETLTGDFKKAPGIVTAPIKGTANTVGFAVRDTIEAPMKAGKTTGGEHRAKRSRGQK
ncbi:MAG: hypothetical protein KKB12_04110 [Candidatus Omnitrophica bacterium]|nr:hypothetical protein [Candidatus Omnitrophota bacterium]